MTTDKIIQNSLNLIKWSPRILGVLFAVFLSLFAFDAFDGDASTGKKLIGFIIHLLPAIVITVLVVVSWKWPWVGGTAFLLLAGYYIFWFTRGSTTYTIIYLPLVITGILFLISWLLRYRNR